MSIVRLLGTSALCAGMLTVAAPVMAQDAPKVEVSGGYSYLHVGDSDELEHVPAGWYADVAGHVTPMLGIVGQVTGNYKTVDDVNFKFHTFAAGARVSGNSGGVSPFGQVLVGIGRATFNTDLAGLLPADVSDSSSDPILSLGAGVNVRSGGAVGVRVGADYVRLFSEDDGTNLFRVNVGITFGH
jgi:hypothetical protein